MVLVQDLADPHVGGEPRHRVPHAPVADRTRPGDADRLVFDLDPGAPATVVECCEVALWLRERLAADGIEAYAKTSGSKGLHLLAALEPTPSGRATAYAKELADGGGEGAAALVVHRMTRSLRPGKVFVDYSQNAARKTTATPYTLRARPAADGVRAGDLGRRSRAATIPRGSSSWPRTSLRASSGTGICWRPCSTRTTPARCRDRGRWGWFSPPPPLPVPVTWGSAPRPPPSAERPS